jgi:hypothetical protein
MKASDTDLVLYNIVNRYYMSDTGFACPRCHDSFPTEEMVAKHLKNDHIESDQDEKVWRRRAENPQE